jgi:hypothetical protein
LGTAGNRAAASTPEHARITKTPLADECAAF